MHQEPITAVTVFTPKDFPSRMNYGASVYRGVLVVWDKKRDKKILEVIDHVVESRQGKLGAIHQHNGGLYLFWKDDQPICHGFSRDRIFRFGDEEQQEWMVCVSRTPKGEAKEKVEELKHNPPF